MSADTRNLLELKRLNSWQFCGESNPGFMADNHLSSNGVAGRAKPAILREERFAIYLKQKAADGESTQISVIGAGMAVPED